MAQETEPQEVVDVRFSGGGSGRLTRADARALGATVIGDETPEPAAPKTRKPRAKAASSAEADENTD